MNASAYLERIGYTGPTTPTVETLIQLQQAHMSAVPFENLDIGLGRKIVCDEAAFLRKIVDQHRGGLCYELNGAFAALLSELGFQVTLLSARVPHEDGTDSPEFDHLALRVDLDEPWLADVGFGDSFVEPLPLKPGIERPQHGWIYHLVERRGSFDMERREPGGTWKRQYSFTLLPRRLEEFAPMCHYHQTSPESPFTRKSICSRATPSGRITIADRKLIVTRDGEKRESMLNSDDEWRAVLRANFGVVL
jgi:N-hydroxyarylamine O-acetyltransferase